LSEQNPKPTAAPNAAEVTDRAADWIQRRDFWNWSNADQAALDAWLAESMAHRIAYFRLDAAWGRTIRLAALRSSAPSRNSTRDDRLRPVLVRTAAVFLVANLMAVGGVKYFSRTPEITYRTGIGEHKSVTFADGSQVDLNTNTKLSVRVSGTYRVANLTYGEAYFQIKHDSKRPFAVIASNHRVTDLGTKFLVRSDPNLLEVVLVEGRAQFDAPDGRVQSPILLTPGDRLVVSDNLIRTMKKPAQDLANELGWRRGMLIFENTPLRDVVGELNRYNTEKIVVANDSVASIRISAAFRTNGIDDLTQLAQAMLGLRVQHLRSETVISR
jgi:transmembrane sensor